MTGFFAGVAGVIYIIGYVIYNYPVLKSAQSPDLIPWIIFGSMGFLNARTYRDGTGNEVMALINEVGAAASFVTLLIAFWMGGRTRRLLAGEWLVVGLGACCILASRLGFSPFIANGFVMAAFGLGAYPIWSGVQRDPKFQKFLPWSLWTGALAISFVVDLFEFQHYTDLIQPVFALAMHGAITLQIAPD